MNKFVLACLVLLSIAYAMAQENWQSAELVDEIRHSDDSLWVRDGARAVEMASHIGDWAPNFRFKAKPAFLEMRVTNVTENSRIPTPVTTTTPEPVAPAPTPAPVAPAPTPAPVAPAPTCTPQTCMNGGECSPQGVCVCKSGSGWTGPNCATKASSMCHDVICLNGGKCQAETGACQCWGNFKGSRCEIVPPKGEECKNINCLNGGACENGFCKCINNFSGIQCEVDPCLNKQCLNNGRCEAGKCMCRNGFFGDNCENDPCSKIQCKNGGKCLNGACQCTDAWEGPHCEFSMKTPAPLNTVVPMIPAYDSCACPGLNPVNCSTLTNNTCADGSKATVTQIKETISLVGVSPKYPCHTIPCRNGGVCREGKCKCKKGFLGLVCEIDKCDSMKCEHGICKSGQCFCESGWMGRFCHIDKCSKIQCQNGATCVDGKCICPADYAGKYCQRLSASGRKRRSINKKLARNVRRLNYINGTLPVYQNVVDFASTKGALANGTKVALRQGEALETMMKDTISNSYAQPPRLLRDEKGKVSYHNLPLKQDIEEDIRAVPITNPNLKTDLRTFVKAKELDKNATELRAELVSNMANAAKIGLVETQADAETFEDVEEDLFDF